jgi:hypothetical protein
MTKPKIQLKPTSNKIIMDRPYLNNLEEEDAEQVNFFVGTEVEQTPAYGKKTLFIVGKHTERAINGCFCMEGCEAFYFGANQSFDPIDGNDWIEWENMILGIMQLHPDKYITLDLDYRHYRDLAESVLMERSNFIPMISVKMPYIALHNYNTCVKIDDIGFNITNPGVWVHRLHDLQDTEKFTPWTDYTNDKTL